MNIKKCEKCGEFHLTETNLCVECNMKMERVLNLVNIYSEETGENYFDLENIKTADIQTLATNISISYDDVYRCLNQIQNKDLEYNINPEIKLNTNEELVNNISLD